MGDLQLLVLHCIAHVSPERLQQQSVSDPDPDKRTLHTNTLVSGLWMSVWEPSLVRI
jgi:hypothetical protein